ncbi:hypothetical protein ACLB1M_10720 [Escherichia coli]
MEHIYSSFGAERLLLKITSIRAPPSMLSPATILPSYCAFAGYRQPYTLPRA